MFKKGGYTLTGQTLNSVLDHPKIQMELDERSRILESLKYYKGKYGKLTYTSTKGKVAERPYSTINMSKKVASEYAKVIFNEQAEITIDIPSADWVNKVLENNDFKKKFTEYLEPGMALGGLVVRPYYDGGSKGIKFSWALADAFYPLQSNTNNISEGALSFLYTETINGTVYYFTLLEFHEWRNGEYIITNELYKSEFANETGSRVPLDELHPDMQETSTLENLSRPIFSYLKTAGFNNLNPLSVLGLGVCDNCKNTLDRINKTYDQFNREIDKGKRKIAAPESLLKGVPNQYTGEIDLILDEEEDLFQIISGVNSDEYKVQDLTSEIRAEAYIKTINHHLKTLEMETGLSTGTFTFNGDTVRSTKTATEVVSEQSQTFQSRNMQITQVEKFIKELIISICELGRATVNEDGVKVYDGEIPTADQIGINFDDGVFIDKEAERAYYMSLGGAGYLPGYYILSKLLDLPKEEAKKLYREAQGDTIDKMVPGSFKNDPLPPVTEEE